MEESAAAGVEPQALERTLSDLIGDLEDLERLIGAERDRVARERHGASMVRLRARLARMATNAQRAVEEIRQATLAVDRTARHLVD